MPDESMRPEMRSLLGPEYITEPEPSAVEVETVTRHQLSMLLHECVPWLRLTNDTVSVSKHTDSGDSRLL